MKRAILLLCLFAPPTFAVDVSSTPTRDLIVTDGWVQAIKEADGIVYIGGKFSAAGPWSGSGVIIDATTGEPFADSPKINGVVSTAVSDGAGGYFIGGEFTRVGTQTRKYVAHINAQHQLDTAWAPDVGSVVRHLALHNGVVYFNNSPVSQSGGSTTKIGAIQASNGALLPFSITISGDVDALLATDDRLFVGGRFTQATTSQAWNLAAYTLDGQLMSWNPGVNEEVLSLGINGDTLYLGGYFTSVGATGRNYLAAVNAKTGAVLPWNPGNAQTTISTLTVADGSVYVAGFFDTMAGQPRSNFAAFDATTGDLLDFQTALAGYFPPTIFAGAGYLVFGGNATFGFDPKVNELLSVIDRQTGLKMPLHVRPNFNVLTGAANGSEFFVGGIFSMVAGQQRIGAAAFNAKTGELTDWNPHAETNVLALAVAPDRIFIAGELNSIGGQPRKNIGAVDRATGALITDWRADADFGIIDMAIYHDQLYVGGSFRAIGGQARTNAAALDINTGAVLPWDPQLNKAQVKAVTIYGDTLYLGGLFRFVGATTRNRLAAFDLTTGQLTGWNPNGSGLIEDIEVAGSTIYVCGRFSSIGGIVRSNVAALSLAGEVLPWAPNVDSAVYDIAMADNKVFVIGEMNSVNQTPRSKIAAIDANTGDVVSWDPNIDFFGNCVTVAGNQLYVGGVFYRLFNEVRLGFASFELSTPSAVPPLDGASVHLDQNGVVEFQFDATGSITVVPQVSEDLLIWTDLPAVQTQPGAMTIRDDSSATRPASFYRLKVSP